MNRIPYASELPSTPQATLYAEAFRSGLYDRILGGLVDFSGRTSLCVYISSGSITLLSGDESKTIPAPAILWHPKDDTVRLRAQAGSNGVIMVLSEAVVANAIGHNPEAVALRLMSARDFALGLADKTDIRDRLFTCLTTILQEIEASQTGKDTIIEAQIRIMLVLLWRAGVSAPVGSTEGNPASDPASSRGSARAPALANLTLERFRHLVEAHLRDRWPVARFADELGITPDRLHDICKRTLGKPPQRLVQERLVLEAQALLERSHQTLDQMAAYLGFRSTSQFSAFFKTRTGLAPGAFRKAVRQKDRAAELTQNRSNADWP